MSCFCYICKKSTQVESHEDFVESEFTLKNCTGNLYILGYSIALENTYLAFRLNRSLAIVPQESTITFQTWTIEDCLFVEIHGENSFLGLGKMYLARSPLAGTQEIKDIEWYTDVVTQVNIELNYKAFPSKLNNAVAVYRKSFFSEDTEKLDLVVKVAGSEFEHKMKDRVLGFKEETWQTLVVCEKNCEVECVLKSGTKESSLILNTSKEFPVRNNIPTPSYNGDFLNIYVIPFHSLFFASPSTTFQFQLRVASNFWLGVLSATAVLSVALKSSMSLEGLSNEFTVPVSEIQEIFEAEFTTFTSEDKILIKCSDEANTSVGILKLKDLPGLEFNTPYETNAQMGYNSCQFWITTSPREKNTREVKALGHENDLEKMPSKLTYKDPVFLDVLELIEYKINRIKKKNSLATTQINKIVSKNEVLKKQISELERAPSIADYKAPAQKNKVKAEPVRKEMFEGICGCGRPNPKFKGYCETCVKELKSTYEKVFNWYSPIETKHQTLEDRYVNFFARKLLLEGKVKRLEEKISKPIGFEGEDMESTAELAAGLRKLEEEINGLEKETENTAMLYSKQRKEYQAEIEKNVNEHENQKKIVEATVGLVKEIDGDLNSANERMVFKQYFNDKYGNKK